MNIKMILPALTEAKSPFWRPIKYSLFPPLGLATLAGYLSENDQITIQDEHVETLDLDDKPDLVVIQVYITSAYRAYQIANHYRQKGVFVCLGGLHVTSLPDERGSSIRRVARGSSCASIASEAMDCSCPMVRDGRAERNPSNARVFL